MNDSTKKYAPDQLYREYQNSRDNIPESIYQEIVSQAEQVQHEDNIHLILQQAKLSDNTKAQQTSPTNSQAQSIAERIKALFTVSPVKSFGTAFASVALAVIILPIAMNSSPEFSEVSHLDGCADCATYINNASVTTRSVTPGLSSISPEEKIAARLGRLSASMKIAAALEQDSILEASLPELKKLAAGSTNSELKNSLQSTEMNPLDIISAVKGAMVNSQFEKNFIAAESIHIANITARFAVNEGQTSAVMQTLSNAARNFAEIEKPSVLQQNLLNEMRAIKTTQGNLDKKELHSMIELYNRSIKSLGA